MTSGYTALPEPDWLEAPTAKAAWDMYHDLERLQPGRYGYPVADRLPWENPTCWRLHPRVGIVADRRLTMAEYLATRGPVHAPPSPGSSAAKAKAKDEDKKRISERAARAAEKRRKSEEKAVREAETAAEEERRRRAQGAFNLEGA